MHGNQRVIEAETEVKDALNNPHCAAAEPSR